MARSYTTVFGDPDDFAAALSGEGVVRFLLTAHGRFRARVTQLLLHHLCLSAGKEELARIAFVAVPPDTVLVLLASDQKTVPVCAGVKMRRGEIITLGPGQRVHLRTAGPSSWAAIRMPDQDLVQYGRAVCGAGFVVPPFARWRPPAAAEKHLRRLQRSAVRVVEAHSEILADDEAAHGLEQQLIEALIECLSQGSARAGTPRVRLHQEIVVRLEVLLEARPEGYRRMVEIRTALGVSAHGLRIACEEQLGMRPTEYVRRRRMQLAHRVLRNGKAQGASVSAVARRFGFRDLGNFAANYRALYSELPSATLQRGAGSRDRLLGRDRV